MKNGNSPDDCSCNYLLQLSSAESQDDLKKRLILLFKEYRPSLEVDIIDEYSYASLKAKNTQTQHNSNTVLFPIYNQCHTPIGQITIMGEHADKVIADDLINNSLKLYNQIYLLFSGSNTDALTKLNNRKAFELHINQIYKESLSSKRRASDSEKPYCIAMIDIDHFKSVNDKHGHLLGDEVLILIAQIMQQSLRENDLLFRFGGEEFVAILQNATLDQAKSSLERFRTAIANYIFPQVGELTVSIGYCQIDVAQNYDLLLERADAALYHAKHQGRNQCLNYEQLVSSQRIDEIKQRSGDIELF